MNENPKGWPLTDPYPFRDSEWPPSEKKEVDCGFVARDKECAKDVKVEELGDYSYILSPAWRYINELYQKVQDLKEHIQWLNNIGGERLNMACGIDITYRELFLEKQKEKKEKVNA